MPSRLLKAATMNRPALADQPLVIELDADRVGTHVRLGTLHHESDLLIEGRGCSTMPLQEVTLRSGSDGIGGLRLRSSWAGPSSCLS